MTDHLSREAAYSYFEISQVTYHFGLIPLTLWLERMRALAAMCAPDDPSKAFVDQILQINEWEAKDEWFGIESDEKLAAQTDMRGPAQSVIEPEADDNFGLLLRFTPAGSIGLSQWVFHQYDPDYFPSVPHGHYQKQKQPKLDAYVGWVYMHAQKKNREPRNKIIALWNDTKFRDFARGAINYYLTHFPHYRGWRVRNPRRLPRRRP